ncbi:hypothetical protein [Tissierella sp. P1]|uniref:hypothetical protein n=1 Tax=Tissierella sp. P1 TaxID=1280483 RepID=UPI001F19EB83|nr:hypothetical protein [Tissierella sp. P1]
MRLRKPEWIRVKMQGGTVSNKVNSLISDLSLNTVCNEANCLIGWNVMREELLHL